MEIEPHMRAITDAARIVKASLPPGHAFELADLVSIGVERVLRYLSDSARSSGVLVFVCAKQGMLYEARKWSGRDPHGLTGVKARKSSAPKFCDYDDAAAQGHWDQWRRFSLPIESMIDIKRALLGMQLREAVAWYSHHWLCEDLGHLEPELGVSQDRVRQYCAAARAKLAAAWRGESFETEDEIQARKARDAAERAERRAAANARMLTDRRARYAELRRLGMPSARAAHGAATPARFKTLTRQHAPAPETPP